MTEYTDFDMSPGPGGSKNRLGTTEKQKKQVLSLSQNNDIQGPCPDPTGFGIHALLPLVGAGGHIQSASGKLWISGTALGGQRTLHQ
jgi:hypothetical protein